MNTQSSLQKQIEEAMYKVFANSLDSFVYVPEAAKVVEIICHKVYSEYINRLAFITGYLDSMTMSEMQIETGRIDLKKQIEENHILLNKWQQMIAPDSQLQTTNP